MIVVVAGTCVAATAADGATAAKPTRLVNFGFASTPPAPAGLVCPGSSDCWNVAVEPQIRADGAGTFYVSSENGLLHGTIAAKSTDGGRHYASLPSPNELSSGEEDGFAPGGGDTDLATAPVANANGFYNVYVASLSLANITVSTSLDGGASWKLNPTSALISGDDREWIAADAAGKVCISYHDVETFNVDVDCSYDAGTTFSQHAVPGAIDPAHAFLLQNNQIGNIAVDPQTHVVYQVMAGIANPNEVVCGLLFTCAYHAVWMGVSTDGGRTFTDHPVFVGRSDKVGYNHQFPNVSVDRAGNVYVLFSDDHEVFYSVSVDRGRTWSQPVALSRPPASTAIFPWAAAGDAGKLDVVYYGTSYFDGSTRPDDFPRSAAWHVFFTQVVGADGRRPRIREVRATPDVHFGGVCQSGITCGGNRDLFDDIGVAASPTTGLASIAYTDDQYRNDAGNPPSPSCTPERTNTMRCDHTSITTQTSGPGIFGASDTSGDGDEGDDRGGGESALQDRFLDHGLTTAAR